MPDPDHPGHHDGAELPELLGLLELLQLLDGNDALVRFVQDVRGVARRSLPAPSPALARVLHHGFSPAVVDRPAPPAIPPAVPPTKEKQHTIMKSSRILKSRAVRVLAVSTTLLVGVSTAAAAGALPGTGQHDAASVHAAALLPRPGVDGSAQAKVQADAHGPLPRLGDVGAAADLGANAGAGGAAGVSAGGAGGLDVTTTAGGVGAGGTGSRKGAATVKGAVAGGVNLGGAGSGLVSGLSGLGTAVTGCLNSVLSTATGNPLIAVGSVLPTVVACVKNIIGSLPVPAFVSSCVSGLLGALNSLPVVGSGTGQIDLTGCLPINLSTCVAAAINSIGGLLGGLTGVSNVPSSIVACASSIVNGVLSLINSLPGQVTGAVSGGVGVGLGASAHASARLGTH